GGTGESWERSGSRPLRSRLASPDPVAVSDRWHEHRCRGRCDARWARRWQLPGRGRLEWVRGPSRGYRRSVLAAGSGRASTGRLPCAAAHPRSASRSGSYNPEAPRGGLMMPTIISQSLLAAVSRLDPADTKRVVAFLDKFGENPSQPGLSLERI